MGFLYFIVSFDEHFSFSEKKNQQPPKQSKMAKGKSAGAGKRVKKVLKANASSVAVVVLSASPVPSTVKSVTSSAASSMVLFVMPPPTLNTPSTRPSPSKTSSPLSASAVVLSTVSKLFEKKQKLPLFFPNLLKLLC